MKDKNINNEKNIKFSLKKYKTKKMIHKYNLDSNKFFLFYTDSNNLNNILNYGINPVNEIKLSSKENYTVWSYSQLHDQIQLELEKSKHNNFWMWLSNQEIDISSVAVIGIDIHLLFQNCKKNWKYNSSTTTISIFENISPENFIWIMIKNKKLKQNIEKIISNKDLKIKLFYSVDGNVKI